MESISLHSFLEYMSDALVMAQLDSFLLEVTERSKKTCKNNGGHRLGQERATVS